MPPNSRNSGTISTWLRDHDADQDEPEHSAAPRNRSRDSANAGHARAIITVRAAISAEVMKLEAYQFQMSPCVEDRRERRQRRMVDRPGDRAVVSRVGLERGVEGPGERHQPEQGEGDQHARRRSRLNSLVRRSRSSLGRARGGLGSVGRRSCHVRLPSCGGESAEPHRRHGQDDEEEQRRRPRRRSRRGSR